MATHVGTKGVIEVGANEMAELIEFTITETTDTAEDTVQTDTYRTYKPTFRSWTGTATAQWDPSDTTGQEALTNGAEATLTFYPDDSQTGDIKYSGAAIVTSVERSLPLGDTVKVSFSFQGNGALTQGTVS